MHESTGKDLPKPLPTEPALAACDQIEAALAEIAVPTEDYENHELARRHLARLAKVVEGS